MGAGLVRGRAYKWGAHPCKRGAYKWGGLKEGVLRGTCKRGDS